VLQSRWPKNRRRVKIARDCERLERE
jgi:hypothetical protein